MHVRQYFNIIICRKYYNRNMDYGLVNVDSLLYFIMG